MSGAYSSPSTQRGVLPQRILNQRGLLIGVILATALVGFEMFNFSTTEVALQDLLGELKILGISWATILTIAFCGIDFAGIARLFIPEDGQQSTSESWYLFGAWLIAATMNAVLTWWGISLGLVNRLPQAASFIDPQTLTGIVPVFVALMVWVTRILLIGSFSVAGSRLFSQSPRPFQPLEFLSGTGLTTPAPQPLPQPAPTFNQSRPRPGNRSELPRTEPEYVPDPRHAAPQPASHSRVGDKETGRPANREARF